MDAILWTLSQEEERRRKQEESEARKSSSHEREHKQEEVPPFRFITVQSSGSDTPLPPPPKEVSTRSATTTSSMTHCLYDDMSEGESGGAADGAAADETAGTGAVTRYRRWSQRSSCSVCSVDEEFLLLQQSCTENWMLDFFNHICCVSSAQLQLEDEEGGSKTSAGHRNYNRRSSIEV